MKTIFSLILTVALLAGTQIAFASHIPIPDLPIGETAYKIQRFLEPCGKVIVYSYKQNGFWAVYTLNGKWLTVISYDNLGLPEKAWLIRNLDGHINEYIDNFGDILMKYQSICDAVVK